VVIILIEDKAQFEFFEKFEKYGIIKI